MIEVLGGGFNGTRPLKAKIAVPGSDRDPGHRLRVYAGSMNIELLGPKAVGPGAVSAVDELRSEYVAVERVRLLPVRDVDHAMIEFWLHGGILSLENPNDVLETSVRHSGSAKWVAGGLGGQAPVTPRAH